MLYVIEITKENLYQGEEEETLYRKFFENASDAVDEFRNLRKRIRTEKEYDFTCDGKHSYCGDSCEWAMYSDDDMNDITITLNEDTSTFYHSLNDMWVLDSHYSGGGKWGNEQLAKQIIFFNPRYTFDNFFTND